MPATAINQLEMWQADTFDPARIDLELGWAEGIGMNTMRVFLHDLLWQQDPQGFRRRIDQFLTIAAKHRIKPDVRAVRFRVGSVAEARQAARAEAGRAQLRLGAESRQRGAPGSVAAWPRLEGYVKGVIGRFARRSAGARVGLVERADNTNGRRYNEPRAEEQGELVLALLPQVFAWARDARPTQPLTSGVWRAATGQSSPEMPAIDRVQLALSDVVTFHSYDPPPELESGIQQLQALQPADVVHRVHGARERQHV